MDPAFSQLPTMDGVPAFVVERQYGALVPLVLNAPHSGSSYSPSFLAASRLNAHRIRTSEDVFVDDLFRPATQLGIPLLRANFPRSWLDVNREPYELDPLLIAGPLPAEANTRSARVAGGLGTVPRLVAENEEIYRRPLSGEEALARIESVYKPYHQTLRQLVEECHDAFGLAVLVDCHSMPSAVRGSFNRHRPDFVLGDRYGTSCNAALTDFAGSVLSSMGYRVSRNRPYAGGYITENYGQPDRQRHTLQIEINRSLYMNERTLEPNSGYARTAGNLRILVAEMAGAISDGLLNPPLAAE